MSGHEVLFSSEDRVVIIRDYDDGYTIAFNHKIVSMNGLSEPEKLIAILKEIGITAQYEEIANSIPTLYNEIPI